MKKLIIMILAVCIFMGIATPSFANLTHNPGTPSPCEMECVAENDVADEMASCKAQCKAGNCVELNTKIPFDIGRYICGENQQSTLFAMVMASMSKIMLSLVFIAGIIAIIAGGVMMASAGPSQSRFNKGKDIVMRVVISGAILGLAGVLLYMLNPNFFG